MSRLDAFAMRHPVAYAVAAATAFVALLVVSPAPAEGSPETTIEAYGIVRGIVLGALAIALAYAAGWSSSSGLTRAGARSWRLVAFPLVYLSAVFPLLFTGTWGPNLGDPRLTVLVGLNSFLAGATEELVFRGLIFFVLVRAWGGTRAAAVRAAILAAVLFSLPHLLNLLEGHQRVRVLAQLGWAFVLGVAFAWLAYAGRSVWSAVAVHGLANAVVATNRIGVEIEITPAKGLLMVAASLPVLAYAWLVLSRRTEPVS